MVTCLAVAALLVAAGARLRDLGAARRRRSAPSSCSRSLIEPYRMARLTGFLNPGADPGGAGFQAIQAKIALGSGGLFGVGLGESLQKAFYLPEAHTDMIAAVIGEELGLVGIGGAGRPLRAVRLRRASGSPRRARDRYGKLLAAGLTSLVLVQAMVNLFAVLGLAPLTGVPLPFVSYGNASLLVMLAAVGLLLNVARGGSAGSRARGRRARDARLRVVDGGRGRARAAPGAARGAEPAVPRVVDSGGGNRGARRAGAGRRRRASG